MVATLPQWAQIKLLFALRQAVFQIEPTYACACAHAHTTKIKICPIYILWLQLYPQGAQIKLLFALRQAVFEIEPTYACACAHARAYDENKNLPNIHSMVATLPPGGPN